MEPANFSLGSSPSGRAIELGQVATFTLSVQPFYDFSDLVTLAVPAPPPGLTLSLSPLAFAPQGIATLAVTDTHEAPLLPGLGYTLPITATGGEELLKGDLSSIRGGT